MHFCDPQPWCLWGWDAQGFPGCLDGPQEHPVPPVPTAWHPSSPAAAVAPACIQKGLAIHMLHSGVTETVGPAHWRLWRTGEHHWPVCCVCSLGRVSQWTLKVILLLTELVWGCQCKPGQWHPPAVPKIKAGGPLGLRSPRPIRAT
jgi:hypothetical protein